MSSPPQPRIGAVILAAGASTRMGTPKQLLPVEGVPMLVRAIDATLAAPVWPVVVVLGAFAEKIRPTLAKHPVLVAENPAWTEGMASSLRTGITTLQQFSRMLDGALITLCDQPAYGSSTVERLLAEQRASGKTIVASHYAGRRGAPALFLRRHFRALGELTGEEGARSLLYGDPAEIAVVDLPELANDLDTPADYAALRTGAATQPS